MREFDSLECNYIVLKQDAVCDREPVSFLKKGSDMASSIKSKDNSTKDILNLLEFSYIVFTYTI